MLLHTLTSQNLIQVPRWLPANCLFLTLMGSMAYGVASESSDWDVYGFCVPPRDLAFAHLAGEIPGFGTQKQRFQVWQQHHVKTLDGRREYDFSVYSIIRYFHLAMEMNPNMVDSLFTPRRCVLHSTAIAEHVRENRHLFLSKLAFHKFKGYAYSQMAKIRGKVNASNPQRAETIGQFGYDVKFAYHLVRLLNECEMILVEHDLDLERNGEQLKSIRRGEWTLAQVEEYFAMKEIALEKTYADSTLRHSPDEPRIKTLLLDCLEQHYGTLEAAVARNPSLDLLLGDLRGLLDRYSASPAIPPA